MIIFAANVIPFSIFRMKYKPFLSLFWVSLLCVIQTVTAQPLLKCTEFKSGGAMEHSRVSSYVQDSKGLLWFGTWVGLCRYDGKEFRYFRNEGIGADGARVPLGSNRVMKMVLDSRENIWCQNYDQGLYRFDRKTSTFQSVLPLVKEYPAVRSLKNKTYVMMKNHAVWAVLADGTLVRFNDADPSDNVVLPCPAGTTNRTVYEVREDSQGREWILTDQGVLIYGQCTVSTYPYSRFVEQDGHCLLSSTTMAQVVEFMADGTLRTIPMPDGVRNLSNMQSQRDGIVSLSADGGLVLHNVRTGETRFITTTADGQPIRHVTRVKSDSKRRIWFFADGSGLYCVEPDADVARFLKNPSAPNKLNNESGHLNLMTEDAFGVIWAKPSDGDLCWVDEATMTLHCSEECLPEGQTFPVLDYNFYFVDAQRNLWVSSGTRIYELTFGRRQFHPIFLEPNVEVRALLADESQFLWYGDKRGRLCRYSLATGRRQYLSPDGRWSATPVIFQENGIYSMIRDSKGRIWIGTRGDGLYVLKAVANGYAVQHYTNRGGLYDLNCYSIYDFYEDEYQRLWIATFGGGLNLVDELADGTVRFLHAGNELLGFPINAFDVVRCVRGDGKGHILAGTNKGLLAFSTDFSRLSEVTFHLYQAQTQQENPIQANIVMQILCDTAQNFYVSTYGRGMSRVHGRSLDSLWFEQMRNRDYPAGDVTMSGIALRSGALWTLAECGVTCYDPTQGRKWYFDEHDFDRPYALTECKPVELADGTVCMGMFGGIFTFKADALRKSLYSPEIVFTEREYADGAEQYHQDLNDIDTLIVEPNQRSTSLHFAALDFVPSRLIRYAYWLQSQDDDDQPKWVYTVTPEVNFANLSPGKYQLHILSTNSDGIWRNNVRVLTILVNPTFWERWGWLFVVSFILAGALATTLWYVQRLKRRQQQQVKQEVSAAKIEILTRSGSDDQAFVQKLMSVLEAHLTDSNLQVNDLCDEMNVSRATFYRRLKQAVDLAPNEFIHQVRMKRASEMLSTSDVPVNSIAYAVGFNNPKYFSKCFRLDFGMTPAEYRLHHRQAAPPSGGSEALANGIIPKQSHE